VKHATLLQLSQYPTPMTVFIPKDEHSNKLPIYFFGAWIQQLL